MQNHGSKAVLEVEIDEAEILRPDVLTLSKEETVEIRKKIKNLNEQRIYKFNKYMVWAPIVGTTRVRGDQFKWESKSSEVTLNSFKVKRRKV